MFRRTRHVLGLTAVLAGTLAVAAQPALAAQPIQPAQPVRAAQPAPSMTIGGGDGILVQVHNPTDPNTLHYEICTLTAVGYDAAGNLVGLTNAHCFIDPAGNKLVGDKVYKTTAPSGQGLSAAPLPTAQQVVHDAAAGAVGTSTYVSTPNNLASGGPAGLDYAVIQLDPTKVAPTNTVGGVTITSIGDIPPVGTRICKQGWRTGLTCGVLTGSDPIWFTSLIWTWGGDSGSPTVAGNTLIGNAWGAFHHTRITSILADLNARGGVGAGFHLAP
ncbi:peptidase S1 [Kitasatospora sp. NPDC008050]|uniref:peptidase S1 n=1 Tax=Kitasatospora sp. NPDC008050 TaxID=3364021 RepID=UPI0036EBA3E6